MADLGTLPSKTSVTITIDDEGTNARIPGANPQQAGVMTAEQARVVEAVRILLASGQFESNVEVLGRQASTMPLGDLSLPPPVEVLPPNHSDDLVRRVAALERSISSGNDTASMVNAVTQLRSEVAHRLTSLESRVTKLEMKPDDLAQIRHEVNEMGEVFTAMQDMLNDPTPVMVET